MTKEELIQELDNIIDDTMVCDILMSYKNNRYGLDESAKQIEDFYREEIFSIINKYFKAQGHWINNHTQCSICEWGMEDDTVGKPITVNFPYCPNCGVKMSE